MTKPKFRWRLEIVIGLAATVTSACALMVSIMQARYSYEQQKAMGSEGGRKTLYVGHTIYNAY